MKRKKTDLDISRRNLTYKYFINEGDGHIQVCQKFILATLDISQRHLLYTLSNQDQEMAKLDQRHPNVPSKYTQDCYSYAKKYMYAPVLFSEVWNVQPDVL